MPNYQRLIDILEYMQSGFDTISTQNGEYLTDVKLVDAQFKLPAEIADGQFPSLMIVPGTMVPVETSDHTGQPVFYLYVFGYVKNHSEPVYQMLRLTRDVMRWIARNDRLGGIVDYIRVTRTELSANVFSIFGLGNGFTAPYAAFRMDLEVSYTYDMEEGG